MSWHYCGESSWALWRGKCTLNKNMYVEDSFQCEIGEPKYLMMYDVEHDMRKYQLKEYLHFTLLFFLNNN